MTRASLLTFALAAVVALATAGCELNGFCIDCDPGATNDGGGDGGGGVEDATPYDAGPDLDACTPMGEEVCNGLDDDCNGMIDDDPAQVGSGCGTDVGVCQTGTYECVDGELLCGNGAVLPTPESCNGEDDDCDGTVDDGDPGGGLPCGTDTGECKRGVTSCTGGELVCNGEIGPSPELCDILDNDCDGMLDEGNPEGGAACGDGMGTCMPGTVQCIGGTLQCVGGSSPSFEICDGADNDCDGDIDEDFDFANDPNHCGDCTTVCTVDNGQAGCSTGDCAIAFCFTGWWDLNGLVGDGCEYECDFAGAEVCNGVDDDCDGDIDEDLMVPSVCSSVGECAGTTATCGGIDGWQCSYGPTVTTDASGDIIPESNCDGLDNDCDGVPDDSFTTLGDTCTRGFGACATTGTIVCNAAEDGVECNAATPPSGSAEVCDGVDNDCDGAVDEGAPDDWVQLSGSLWIYKYEASRPDADASSQGAMSHRPCSAQGRLPWTNITQPDAEAQCLSIGARLCSEAEWQQACRSATGTCTWSYGSSCTSYSDSTCNGNTYDFDPGTPGDQDGLLETGALTACYANWGALADRVFDMSGNVKEWTAQRSAGVNPMRGGSYNNTPTGISCNFDFTVADDTFQFQNVGFRCCRTSAP